jgi:cytochrome c oxidase assembly protein subunit 11
MPDKFIKNTLYVVIGTFLAIFLLIQPYNLFCKIKKTCLPITFSSFLINQSGKQKIIINFSAKIDEDLNKIIEFYPKKSKIEVQNGKNITINYVAKNISVNNIIINNEFIANPPKIKDYLEMVECLCFQNQPIKVGEEVLMPVNFRINPNIEKDDLLKNLKEITLSYKPYLVDNDSKKLIK